ncbi:hypothetical protein GW17_00011758 [Ensete ventricosum]|nr:hypothetical protein GW17_00011758 [Ensete ventricosum]
MASEDSAAKQKYPKIDFSELDIASPGTPRWEAVREQVMEALASCGFFEAVFPQVAQELRESFFGTAMKELFALPLDTKLRNTSNKPFHGYLGQIPYLSYESLAILDASLPQGVDSFTSLMWPGGNPAFREMVCSFSKQVAVLDEIIRKMILESLGVEKYHKTLMESHRFLLRVSEYAAAPPKQQQVSEEKQQLGLVPHRDKNTLAIVCQNQVDGLEMETSDGGWVVVTPSPASFIVIAGDANGRVYSPLHRIMVGEEATRYSAILFSIPEDDMVIRAPPELADDHQSPGFKFKPFDYGSYVRFCVTEEGMNASCQLDAFCGVANQQQQQQV